MVKNLETFEEYPWGRESFELTLQIVKVGKKIPNVDELIKKFNQSHTSTHGFTLALHLLFFKAIPQLEMFIPYQDDEQTFTDKFIINLSHLKTFHNSNIMETENLLNVSYFVLIVFILMSPFLNNFCLGCLDGHFTITTVL